MLKLIDGHPWGGADLELGMHDLSYKKGYHPIKKQIEATSVSLSLSFELRHNHHRFNMKHDIDDGILISTTSGSALPE